MAITHIGQFFICTKITKWRTFFEKRKKRIFSPFFAHTKIQLKSKFKFISLRNFMNKA